MVAAMIINNTIFRIVQYTDNKVKNDKKLNKF